MTTNTDLEHKIASLIHEGFIDDDDIQYLGNVIDEESVTNIKDILRGDERLTLSMPTDSSGNDPLEGIESQEEEFEEHLQNVRDLNRFASMVGRRSGVDSMNVSYSEEDELGTVTLYVEFYDHGTDESEDEPDGLGDLFG